jgi:uncharacterized lipoprotein YddW (UPF0748 family)
VRTAVWILAALSPLPAQQYRAFWADAFHSGFKSPLEVDLMVDDVVRARGNAIFVQVRRRADSYYLKTLEVPAEDPLYAPGFDALEYLIERAHARGIEVHAWFTVYPSWPLNAAPPRNPEHIHHRHGPGAAGDHFWMQVSSNGSLISAFDPGHPGVQAYLASVITDPLDHYDLDGIHLDYVRYFEQSGGASSGYNPKALERFRRQEMSFDTPAPRDAAWSEWRRRQVTQLVRQIYLRSIEKKPKVKVSASLISWGNGPVSAAGWRTTDAFSTVFQDWQAWLEEGILDLAMPMHYFDDKRNAAFLNRWLQFSKDRQFGRAYVPGIAPYLNDIPDSLAQTRRALAASAAGSAPVGVAYYSYASTNRLNSQGFPITSNSEFYRRIGDQFGTAAAPPLLAWKQHPRTGHILGWLRVDGGHDSLPEGVTVRISSDTGKDFARTTTTDGTGFFGMVDVPPDRYRVRMERAGVRLWDATPRDVDAGAVTRFEARLKAEDFAGAVPRLVRAERSRAAPGDVVALEGTGLAADIAFSMSVPLRHTLVGTQVVVNGMAAAIFSVSPARVVVQLPYLEAEEWNIVVRRAGMESAAFRLAWVPTDPIVLDVRLAGRGHLEIYATGLGAVEPPVPAGIGADPTVVLPVATAPVRVFIGETELQVTYAGLAPYQPGRYQINVAVPVDTATGSIRLQVGEASSPAYRF